jgi:hypothetical protein
MQRIAFAEWISRQTLMRVVTNARSQIAVKIPNIPVSFPNALGVPNGITF